MYVNNRIGFFFRVCLPWLLSRPLHLYGGHRQRPSHKKQKWRKPQRLERMATISMPSPLHVMTSKYFFQVFAWQGRVHRYTINHWKIRKIGKDVIHYPFNSLKWFWFNTICKQCTITLWALMFLYIMWSCNESDKIQWIFNSLMLLHPVLKCWGIYI